MAKKDLEAMTKIELLEYAKRARYMLGKLHVEREEREKELLESKQTIEDLRALVEKYQPKE